jgi:anti-sigma factor RsiW
MVFNCSQIEARLSDYLDGALTPEDAAACDAHIAECAQCSELAASVRGMLGAMRALEPIPAPLNLVPAILDRTIGPRPAASGWKAWFGWTQFVLQPRFAYGALTVLITAAVISQALGIQWRTPTVADLNPINLYRSADRQAHQVYARGTKFVGDLRIVYEIESILQPSLDQQDTTPVKAPANPQSAPGHSEIPGAEPSSRATRPNHTAQVASELWLLPARSAQ